MQKHQSFGSGTMVVALAASTLISASFIAGCQKNTQAVQPAVKTQAVSATPEESFELIVETFRRGMEEVPLHFLVRDDSGGHSMMTGRIEVSHELIQPAQQSEKLKGIITVRSQTRYSMQRSNEEFAESEKDDQQAEKIIAEESGTQIFDPALVDAPDPNRTTSRPGSSDVTIASEENKSERHYELVYDGGRWVLTTKLDPDNEKSVQNAFDRALNSQG